MKRGVGLPKSFFRGALPLIQAPMAGGITTPELIASVCNAGALGSLATGYLTASAVETALKQTRALTSHPFAVNVFIPQPLPSNWRMHPHTHAYQTALEPFRAELNLPSSPPLPDIPEEEALILECLLEHRVPVLSFTFGMLDSKTIRAFKAQGTYLMGTANTLAEAKVLREANIDAIIAQGAEAGGHRCSFIKDKAKPLSTRVLLKRLKSLDCPIIAAGGIMTGAHITDALKLGASAVQMGTAFLTTKESGANPTYQAALASCQQAPNDPTCVTTVFSGKQARGIENKFMRTLASTPTPPYPVPHYISSPLRKAAAAASHPEYMSLWAGSGVTEIRPNLSVQALIHQLEKEANMSPPSSPNTATPDSISVPVENSTNQNPSQNKGSLPSFRLAAFLKQHPSAVLSLSIFNGGLYFFVALEGGANLKQTFHITGDAQPILRAISAGAALVYVMFTYKTLEALSPSFTNLNLAQKLFVGLAPFSAIAFLTAGQAGAGVTGLPLGVTYCIGATLFALRIVNCVDASVKFPSRFLETKTAWNEAYKKNNYAEMARLTIVWAASIAYVLCTTDAIYTAVQILATWFSALFILSPSVLHTLAFTSGILGAIGTLPLNVYWTHRGLRQLTGGGLPGPDGTPTQDPTDIYTYLGFLAVTPVILGIVGGATAASGQMFGQLGETANITRIVSSIIYAACAGTPGMASLFRQAKQWYDSKCASSDVSAEESQLLKPGSSA